MDPTRKKARILVVEDESIVALDMRSRLASMGYEVVGIAASGEEALDLVRRTSPELILMDIKLQGDLDGVDTADRIKQRDDIPIIFVTAFADERTLARAKVTQAFGYILKPFQEREVLISIEMALYKHRMEKDLRDSQEWLRGTMHAISDGVVALDEEDRIVFMNEAAERLCLLPGPYVRGTPIDSICSFQENKALVALFGSPSLGAGDDDERELQWVTMVLPDAKVPVELIKSTIRGPNGERTGHVLSIRDIAKDISAAAAKTRLAAIVSNSYDAILSIDPERTILSWNLGAELMFGYSSEEMIGRSIDEMMGSETDKAHFMSFVKRVSDEKEVGRFDLVKRCKSGKTISVSAALSPLRNAEGLVSEIACIERDISAEKEYEASLVQAKLNAEESSRVKSEFLSNMSHELRTPLNSIMGMVELSKDMAVSEEQREYLGIARQSADNLLFLINSILDFSKIEAGKMRIHSIVFDPVETVEECLEEVSVQAHRKGLDLLFRAAAGLPAYVEGDPRRFKQIITNLLSNAIKFTEKGSIRVGLDAKAADDVSSYLFALSVRDTGIGIASERLVQIWESFTQLDGTSTRAYGGTGLGLSIVKSLAELMGGTVSVSSEVGKGSEFIVSIPFLLSEQIAHFPGKQSLPLGLPVFVAVPDGEERGAISDLLRAWSCKVSETENADALLKELRKDSVAGNEVFLIDERLPDRQLFFSCVEDEACMRRLKGRTIVLSNIGARSESSWKTLELNPRFLFKPVRRRALREYLTACLNDHNDKQAVHDLAGNEKPQNRDPADDAAGADPKKTREQRMREECSSSAEVASTVGRFIIETEAVGEIPGERLEGIASRFRRELEDLHVTVLPQSLFKIMLACRRADEDAVLEELKRIRSAVSSGALEKDGLSG